ncbi:Trafficking kinesin-binding protein 1 [Liparis tanakae]|uniref:Trafficking kinesin-binding protein 1 n=1 Tax=Liparis tanakae TaxID=230148 RepID=A0A4Z2GNJ7_9TELE|nr:Trafficking kinesin-binding protein 1 [Liparis tanakae]
MFKTEARSLPLLDVPTVLCADRVGQMTKTYSDIDAVTRLLEEKERDLELAARIGQSLLKKNRRLTEQNDYLEERVAQITEEVAQLHHELNLKDELLQFYTNAAEESEDESAGSPTGTRSKENAFGGTLQKKLRELEEENLSLRSEAHHLKSETEIYEEKEQQLVSECVKELQMSSLQISTIAEELARKTGDASRQQEEITHLLSQIVDLQKKAKTELILDDPECEEQKFHRKRVFETVKNINQTVRQRSLTPTGANIPGSNQSLGSEGREKKASGVEDLRLALRRLSLRRQNNLSERRFFEEDRERRRGGGHGGPHDSSLQESAASPSESIMSLGNLHLWASRGPYLPDKLQIVKPLEGEGAGPRGRGAELESGRGRGWAS